MAALHPHQADYFNQLAGRSERLKTVYQMDYWNTTRREALEWLLAKYPGAPIYLTSEDHNYEIAQNALILPEADRRRLRVNVNFPDFIIASEGANPIWTREIYGGVITAILDRREAARAKKIAAYESAVASERLAESSLRRLSGRRLAGLRQIPMRGGRRARALLAVHLPRRRSGFVPIARGTTGARTTASTSTSTATARYSTANA